MCKYRAMSTYTTELPIRPELDAAHGDLATRWATPSHSWSSKQRLSVIAEVRRAMDADELAPWEAPSSIEGFIANNHPLPDAAIDVIWRLTNHPGTLTKEWYESIISRNIDPVAYVELIGLVAQANCVDRFADGLGVKRVDLPDPIATKTAVASELEVSVTTHWVPTAATKGPNVLKALSSVPFENESREILSSVQYVPSAALLGDLTSGHNSLTRLQIELVAARTSKLNECFY